MMNNKLQINKIIEKYPIAAVCLFAFICLFPAMLLRDFTPSNELRYLSIADEAIADGNIFAFTNHGVPYADKPPLYFWIVMLCRLIFGHHSCFALSLFSLVPAFVIVNVMDKWVMSKAPVADRMAAALMLLTCGMFLGTAVVLRMDMLMCMFIVLALRSFYRIYTGEDVSGKESWMLPVWTFMALFTKGPVGLIVPPLGILVFLVVKGKWRETGRYLGWKTWGVIAVLFALWILAAFLDGGKEYFRAAYDKLGPMSRGEKLGLWLFILATGLAFVRPLYVQYLPLMKPAYVFFTFGMLTFMLRNETGQLLLTWREAEKGIMWGMIFLFSGGLALGQLITKTGAATQIAKVITLLPLSGGWETMFSLTLFATFLTEISSNTAAASISIPVVQSISQQLGLNPIPYILTSIVAVNCAFILPVSTRAVGVTYGLNPDDLLKNGLKLSIICMLLVSALGCICMHCWSLFNHL